MQTNEIHEISNLYFEKFPFKDSKIILDPDFPIYPAEKGTYIWYKDSVPTDFDSRILSDEYDVLYQSVKLTEYKSKLKMYVSVYSVCLIVVVGMLFFAFLPDAYASVQANRSSAASIGDLEKITTPDHLPENAPDAEMMEGLNENSLGYADLKNDVIYVILPNGMYSIQESSWDVEEKAVNRIIWFNSLDIIHPDGTKVEAGIEKVDLSAKGDWNRIRIGEFASLKDASIFADRIRTEEKLRNFSVLLVFLAVTQTV